MKIITPPVDKNVSPDEVKQGPNGGPDRTCMKISTDKSLLDYSRGQKAKLYDGWKDEVRPYCNPTYPGRALHNNLELHYLYRTVCKMAELNEQPIHCANLGVYQGQSTCAIAHGLLKANRGLVYAVDLFDSAPVLNNWSSDRIREEFIKRSIAKYVKFCEGYTSEWSKKLSNIKFDFIFIDADHHYESCLQDFKLWSPLLAANGVVAFHDCSFNTVDRVIKEELKEWDLVDHVWSIKSFRRKDEPI